MILIFILLTVILSVVSFYYFRKTQRLSEECRIKNDVYELNKKLQTDNEEIGEKYKKKHDDIEALSNENKKNIKEYQVVLKEKENILSKNEKMKKDIKILIAENNRLKTDNKQNIGEYRLILKEKENILLENKILKFQLEEEGSKLKIEKQENKIKIEQYKKILDIISKKPSVEKINSLSSINDFFKEIEIYLSENSLINPTYINQFSELYSKIEDAVYFPIFYHKKIVALAGEFSSGKTSFMNSLVFNNENILPTSIEPTTAINTFVVHDNDEGLFIRNFSSGQTKIEKKFYQFITHSFKKEFGSSVHSMVKYISLRTKNMTLKNIALLDTPGYTGSSDNNGNSDRAIALDGLENAKAVLWVASAENGTLKEEDLKFLEYDFVKGKPIYIVFNKADLQTETNMKNIIKNAYTTLSDRGFENIKISPYSSLYSEDFEKDKKEIIKFLNSINKSANENNYFFELYSIFENIISDSKTLGKQLESRTREINDYQITKKLKDSDIKPLKSIKDEIIEKREALESTLKKMEDFKETGIKILEKFLGKSSDIKKYKKLEDNIETEIKKKEGNQKVFFYNENKDSLDNITNNDSDQLLIKAEFFKNNIHQIINDLFFGIHKDNFNIFSKENEIKGNIVFGQATKQNGIQGYVIFEQATKSFEIIIRKIVYLASKTEDLFYTRSNVESDMELIKKVSYLMKTVDNSIVTIEENINAIKVNISSPFHDKDMVDNAINRLKQIKK